MARRGLTPGSLVSVSSPRGKLVIRLQASQEVASGQAFMAMHWGRNRLNSHGVNELTLKDFDPHSKQPELKHAVVRIEPAVLPYTTVMMGSAVDSEQARRCTLQWLDQIPPLLSPFGYASVSLVGRNHPAVILNLAHDEPIPAAWLKPLDQLFGLVSGICMEYHDARAHIVKKALLVDHQLIAARLTGETLAAPWLESALLEKQTVTGVRRWLLAPLSTPPASIRVSSRTICNCFEVSEDALQTAIKEGSSLTDLQAALRCGTQCGSCLPEIRRMLGQHQ
jgi:assimilatory nitrate reductase catalytic subunit